jgi:hypothetical protein
MWVGVVHAYIPCRLLSNINGTERTGTPPRGLIARCGRVIAHRPTAIEKSGAGGAEDQGVDVDRE